jgi:acyl-coenzyme A synthetase/AMP-(fatty) acid ligase
VAVGDMLERLIWSYPDQEVFVGWPGAFAYPELERVTYRDANRIANRIANALLAAGCSGKDRVLMVCENSVEAVLTKLAIAKAGLVAAPVNPSLAADVVEDVIKRIEPAFAIVDAEVWPKVKASFERSAMKVAVTIPIDRVSPILAAQARVARQAARRLVKRRIVGRLRFADAVHRPKIAQDLL